MTCEPWRQELYIGPDSDRTEGIRILLRYLPVSCHMPAFRFAAKYGLLTYSQSEGLDPCDIAIHLGTLGAECIVGKENHATEGIHYHAFFMFLTEFRTRNPRVFDIGPYHPNILKGRRTPAAMYDYATKDGDICGGALERPDDGGDQRKRTNENAEYILDAQTGTELLERAQSTDPGLFIRNYFQLRAIAETRDFASPLDYTHPSTMEFSTVGYPELEDWVSTYLGRRGGR